MFDSDEQHEKEWAFAHSKLMHNGTFLPSGTLLSPSEHSDSIKYKFIVIGRTILAISSQKLGSGRDGQVYMAQNREKAPFALKIIAKQSADSNAALEGEIAQDCRTAIGSCMNGGKHYIAYHYLGISLYDYMKKQKAPIPPEILYKLAIGTCLSLHNFHTGKTARSGRSYTHGDLERGTNITLDPEFNTYLIDFGRSRQVRREQGLDKRYDTYSDMLSLIHLFFDKESDTQCLFHDLFSLYTLAFCDEKPDASDMKPYVIYYTFEKGKIRAPYENTLSLHFLDKDGVVQESTTDIGKLVLDATRWQDTVDPDIESDAEPTEEEIYFTSSDLKKLEAHILAQLYTQGHIYQQDPLLLSKIAATQFLSCNTFHIDVLTIPSALELAEELLAAYLGLTEDFLEPVKQHDKLTRITRVQRLQHLGTEFSALYSTLEEHMIEAELVGIIKTYMTTLSLKSYAISMEYRITSLDPKLSQLSECAEKSVRWAMYNISKQIHPSSADQIPCDGPLGAGISYQCHNPEDADYIARYFSRPKPATPLFDMYQYLDLQGPNTSNPGIQHPGL